ncbi:DUF2796 domain-containing protein, partial [Planktotalea sp.]|uniref:ZrgA family zinc uptake protein n=1 Tax=Planktotalea sp. TaxID=2029877 RepID=UPI00329A7746
MKTLSILAMTTLAATTAFAESKDDHDHDETRQLEAHEHGVGTLNVAFDGDQIAMEFEAPGADIVGFEYKAESSEDLAKIEGALATLEQPLDLFALPQAAVCRVAEAHAELVIDDDHDDH